MGTVHLDDCSLNYRFQGPVDAPVLVLSNSLGTDLTMWDAQAVTFSEYFRLLRYDTRGHGASSVPPGPYTIEQLGRDVLGLVDALGIDRFAFCGLSLGGLTGQWLGINADERLTRLVLCSTAAKIGDDDVWNGRIQTVSEEGPQALQKLSEATLPRWFTTGFVQRNAFEAQRIAGMIAGTQPEGYAASCAAVRDADFRGLLGAIKVPTLVVCGTRDAVTPPEHARCLQEQIGGATVLELDGAHLCNVEQAELFRQEVLAFLRDS